MRHCVKKCLMNNPKMKMRLRQKEHLFFFLVLSISKNSIFLFISFRNEI